MVVAKTNEKCLRFLLHNKKTRDLLLLERGLPVFLKIRLLNKFCDNVVQTCESYWSNALASKLHLAASENEQQDVEEAMLERRKRSKTYYIIDLQSKLLEYEFCNTFSRFYTYTALYKLQQNSAQLYKKSYALPCVNASSIAFYFIVDSVEKKEWEEMFDDCALQKEKMMVIYVYCPKYSTYIKLILVLYDEADEYLKSEHDKCLFVDGQIRGIDFELEKRKDLKKLVMEYGNVDSFFDHIKYFVLLPPKKRLVFEKKTLKNFSFCALLSDANYEYDVLTRQQCNGIRRGEENYETQSQFLVSNIDHEASLRVCELSLFELPEKEKFVEILRRLIDPDCTDGEKSRHSNLYFPSTPTRCFIIYSLQETKKKKKIEHLYGLGDVRALLEKRDSPKSRLLKVQRIDKKSSIYSDSETLKKMHARAVELHAKYLELIEDLQEFNVNSEHLGNFLRDFEEKIKAKRKLAFC